jgi:hypothetical protein
MTFNKHFQKSKVFLQESLELAKYGIYDFIKPPQKAKFQLGDIVKVVDPLKRWATYQSSKSREAIDKIVEIVGYKNVPNSYSKYAVKLSNENIYAIHSHFLRKLTDKEIKFINLNQKLPELEGIFEGKIVEDFKKKYLLDQLLPEEKSLIEKISDAVIRDAEKLKVKLLRDSEERKKSFTTIPLHGFGISISNDSEYLDIKRKFTNNEFLDVGWKNFYFYLTSDALPNSLHYHDNKFYLSFPSCSEKDLVYENENWRQYLISNLTKILTDKFCDCFINSQKPPSNELLEFFEKRRYKLQIKKLEHELPEIKGLFESKQLELPSDFVDIALELKQPTQNEDYQIFKNIAKKLASYLQKQVCLNIKASWSCKVEPFHDWEIKLNPLRIVFLNIPKKASDVYKIELKETIFKDVIMKYSYGENNEFKHVINSSCLEKVSVDERGPKTRSLKQKFPEIGTIFESKDDTKKVYGYSLKTFTVKEEELFDAVASGIINQAEKKKKVLSELSSSDYVGEAVINIRVTEDKTYQKIRTAIVKDPQTNVAWRNFYSEAIINIGSPSLCLVNGEFYLKFSNKAIITSYKKFQPEVSEKLSWKDYINDILKCLLTDIFYNFFDSIDPKSHNIPNDIKNFFNERENSIEIKHLNNRLPELKGIFESQETERAILEVTVKKEIDEVVNKANKQLLSKLITLYDIYYKVICTLVETDVNFVFKLPLSFEMKSEKNYKKLTEDSFVNFFVQEQNSLINNDKNKELFDLPNKLPKLTFEWFNERFYKLQKKFKELEGIFENKELEPVFNKKNQHEEQPINENQEKKYVLTVTFEIEDQNDKYLFEKILKQREKNTNFKTKIVKENNKLTFTIFGLPFNLKDNENVKEQFQKLFKNDAFEIFPNMIAKSVNDLLEKVLKSAKSSCQEESFYNLQKKLPEINGLFGESLEPNSEFSLTEEEKNAINEIAETVQNLFKDYEERLVALMKTLKKERLNIFDTKLNKYIGVTHLRNDLRLSIGKICKKHFQTFNVPLLCQKYERVFGKPIVGGINFGEEGVGVFYEDGIFEVLFNSYDFFSGENIRPSKRIEVIEIESHLKKLLEDWLNFTLNNKPLAIGGFISDYLELRKEKTKFNKIKEKLPELNGIF